MTLEQKLQNLYEKLIKIKEASEKKITQLQEENKKLEQKKNEAITNLEEFVKDKIASEKIVEKIAQQIEEINKLF